MPHVTTFCEICSAQFSFYDTVQKGRFCSLNCRKLGRNPQIRRDLLTLEYLRQRYIIDGLTALALAEELQMSKRALLRYMDSFGIQRRKPRGRTISNGYVFILKPDHPYANSLGYVREHRLVMEETLGRYLTPIEVVHHLNVNRQDNSPKNLVVKKNNVEHLKEHNTPERMRAAQKKGRENVRERKKALIANPPLCACGCGRQVNWTMKHKLCQLPRYLHGHGARKSSIKSSACATEAQGEG